MRRGSVVAVVPALAGAVAVAAGALVLGSRAAAQAGFGWFAYAPLSQEQLDGLVVVNGPRALGGALVALGLLLLAGAAGVRLAGVGGRAGRRGAAVVATLLVVAGALALALPRQLVTVGGRLPRSMDDGAARWSFPTVVWSPVQVAGAGAVLVGLLVLAGLVGGLTGRRGRV